MDLTLGPKERLFRDRVRSFMAEALPADLRAKGEIMAEFTREEVVRWWKILSAQGWIAPAWPRSAGGSGWSILERIIFDVEVNRAGAPRYTNAGVAMAGPAILRYGTPEQQARFLPRILAAGDVWCQGYSEPGAGSDLASLTTKAVLDGDHYIVTGTKIWTTLGHWADRMFGLVRTNPDVKQQLGITFLLIDMKTPGITVRPIPRINGVHEFNQIFFDAVPVPVADRLGEEGQGWTIAKHVLMHERMIVGGGFGSLARFSGMLRRVAGEERVDGGPLIENPEFRARLASLEVELQQIVETGMRYLRHAQADSKLGYEMSALKLDSTRVQYEMAELLMEAVGWYALPHSLQALLNGWGNEAPVGPAYAMGLAPNFFDWRKMRIGGGGSDEISHNIIAKQTLRL
ncbi:MAG: pimeloyl-CoA dehydrogenase large subunit [Alphaproteobacteria bacterium]|nr:pimeloyl-CoA dehydrogenase large subunit [Alphaproteobacteria bacterium]